MAMNFSSFFCQKQENLLMKNAIIITICGGGRSIASPPEAQPTKIML
jgi:hypothetical protein